jgi:hypothetical protein
MLLGISLYELILVILGLCVAYWLITKFAVEPYKRWGVFALAIFAIIYLCERLGIFNILKGIVI